MGGHLKVRMPPYTFDWNGRPPSTFTGEPDREISDLGLVAHENHLVVAKQPRIQKSAVSA